MRPYGPYRSVRHDHDARIAANESACMPRGSLGSSCRPRRPSAYDAGMAQLAGASDSVVTPDVTIMKRLGYIRLLYQQAVTQSHAPAPLNFSSVLAFHDVMEYFFVVAVAHLGNPQGLDLRTPFSANVKKLRAPDGNPLSGLDVVRRVGDVRNGFKHHGSIPGPDQVEEVRRDATMFLEGNCRRLFGVEFAAISMLHIVPQDAVRDHLEAGRAAADMGELTAAMAEVAMAFDQLMVGWGRGKYLPRSSPLTGSFDLQANSYRPRRRIEAFPSPSESGVRDATRSLAASVTEALEDVDRELEVIRDVLRIHLTGIDMAGYIRFAMIVPEVSVSADGQRYTSHREGQLHYTSENYDMCEMFVVDCALRLGHRDFRLWMPQTYGDWDRATAAMEANGGRLPTTCNDS